jgi:hypothetical protein
MVSMIKVRLECKDHDFSERELKLIEVLTLNLCAQTNAQVTGEGMALNPVEREGDQLFHYHFVHQKPMTEERYEEFSTTAVRRVENALKMCKLDGISVICEAHRVGEV